MKGVIVVKPVYDLKTAVPKRAWTSYTVIDYIDALESDFALAMRIREALYPGITEHCPVKRPQKDEREI